MPEFSAAVGLAQLEKLGWFVEKRRLMATMYNYVIAGCDWLHPQKTLAVGCIDLLADRLSNDT